MSFDRPEMAKPQPLYWPSSATAARDEESWRGATPALARCWLTNSSIWELNVASARAGGLLNHDASVAARTITATVPTSPLADLISLSVAVMPLRVGRTPGEL